jgi:hypothetical protein
MEDAVSDSQKLKPTEFKASGLPDVAKFGPIEVTFHDGKVDQVMGEHWLARYAKLPAYLGIGSTPSQAVTTMEQRLLEGPVYRTTISRIRSPKDLERRTSQLSRGLYAASEIVHGKQSDFVVSDSARSHQVRKQVVSDWVRVMRNSAGGPPSPDLIAAAEQSVRNEHVAHLLFQQRHPWEWEAIFALERILRSGI